MYLRDINWLRGVEAVSTEYVNQNVPWVELKVFGTQYDDRPDTIQRRVANDLVVFLEPEPTNEYDPNAIKVVLGDGQSIGYVSRDVAPYLRQDVITGLRYSAYVSDLDKSVDYKPADITIHLDLEV